MISMSSSQNVIYSETFLELTNNFLNMSGMSSNEILMPLEDAGSKLKNSASISKRQNVHHIFFAHSQQTFSIVYIHRKFLISTLGDFHVSTPARAGGQYSIICWWIFWAISLIIWPAYLSICPLPQNKFIRTWRYGLSRCEHPYRFLLITSSSLSDALEQLADFPSVLAC